jgi:hypothetical protein
VRRYADCGSAIVNEPTRGRKKKLNESIAAIDVATATQRRAVEATIRNPKETNLGTNQKLPKKSLKTDRFASDREKRGARAVFVAFSQSVGVSSASA